LTESSLASASVNNLLFSLEKKKKDKQKRNRKGIELQASVRFLFDLLFLLSKEKVKEELNEKIYKE
jgi:hypothetical protein